MTDWLKLNVNDTVKVRLTNSGKLAHRRAHDELRRQFPKLRKYSPPKTDADGWSEWQLWHLMQAFGPVISLGSEPPFETTILVGGGK